MLNSGHHCTSHCSTFHCVSTFHFWSQCSVHSSIYFILSSPLVHLVCLSRLPSHRMFECCCLLLKKSPTFFLFCYSRHSLSCPPSFCYSLLFHFIFFFFFCTVPPSTVALDTQLFFSLLSFPLFSMLLLTSNHFSTPTCSFSLLLPSILQFNISAI